MKIYINAGAETYELADMFSNQCKQLGMDPKFKVAIGNMSSEIKRKEKLCIYIDDISQVKQYIEVLENIKSQRQDFKFEKPLLTVGAIDNWIGIGSDMGAFAPSYNKEICGIIIDTCNTYFGNMNRNQINEQLNRNPQVLNSIRKNFSEKCYQNGRSPEKICVKEEDVQRLKEMKILEKKMNYESEKVDKQSTKKSIEKITQEEIKPEDITPELMQILRENEYDGKSGHPILQSYFQIYCKNQDEEERCAVDGKKIKGLENQVERQNDEAAALGVRGRMFENIIGHLISKVGQMKGVLETERGQIADLQYSLRTKKFSEKLREVLIKSQRALPIITRMWFNRE